MTLTERKTRLVQVRKLKDRTQASVLKALRSMESTMGTRVFRAVFKSNSSIQNRRGNVQLEDGCMTMNPNQKGGHLNLQSAVLMVFTWFHNISCST